MWFVNILESKTKRLGGKEVMCYQRKKCIK
jgi:hypothetical protein